MVVQTARAADASVLAGMLRDFNLEFGDPSPSVKILEARARAFIDGEVKTYLLAGDPAQGFAQLSFNASIWTVGPVLLIEELYVKPAYRRRGLGRSLMDRIVELARESEAGSIEVITGEDDTGARALYETFGFRNEIEGEENTRALYYELEF